MTSTAISSPANKRFLLKAEAVLENIKQLPDEDANDLFWFFKFCKDRNLSKDELSETLPKKNGGFFHFDTIDHTLQRGSRQPSEDFMTALRRFREIEEPRAEITESGFVKTRLYSTIEQRFLEARKKKRISFIFGDSQIGKTTCLKHVQQSYNHGSTIFVDMPARGNYGRFITSLAKAMRLNRGTVGVQAQQNVLLHFHSRMTLVIDNAHRALRNQNGLSTIEFILELFDTANCGMVICMTRESEHELRKGPFAERLKQLWRRRTAPLILPSEPYKDDLDRFANAFALCPAPRSKMAVNYDIVDGEGKKRRKTMEGVPFDIEQKVIAEEGLGVWLSILQDSAELAKKSKKPHRPDKPECWAAVIKAHAIYQADCGLVD